MYREVPALCINFEKRRLISLRSMIKRLEEEVERVGVSDETKFELHKVIQRVQDELNS